MKSSFQDSFVQQEDYTRAEKLQRIEIMGLTSFLQVTAAGFMVYFSLQLYQVFPHESNVVLLALASLLLAIGVLSLMWACTEPRFLKQANDKWYDTNRHRFSRLLFITNAIALPTLLVVFAYVHQCIALSRAYISITWDKQAEQEGKRADYDSNFLYLVIVSAVQLVLQLYATFVAYMFSNTSFTFRIAIYTVGLGVALFLMFHVHQSQQFLELWEKKLLPLSTKVDLVRYLVYCSAFFLCVIFALYFINYNKLRTGYNNSMVILLVLATVTISFNGLILRDALNMEFDYSFHCKSYLNQMDQDLLSQNGCRDKYLEVGQNYLSCPKLEQVIIWEKSTAKDKSACLNMKCCKVPQLMYQNLYLRIGCSGLWLGLMCLIYAGFCNFLINKFVGSQFMSNKAELLFFLCVIIILAVGGFFILQQDRAGQQYITSAKQLLFAHRQQVHAPSGLRHSDASHNRIDRDCSLFKDMLDTPLSFSAEKYPCPDSTCASSLFRVSLLSFGGVLRYPPN